MAIKFGNLESRGAFYHFLKKLLFVLFFACQNKKGKTSRDVDQSLRLPGLIVKKSPSICRLRLD